ncbi:MAG TPA: amidohydrolase family protein, partial [Thermoanaerobaculia bacterium]|nr:amidohydrolase family protein [Thermoanaerobaculia bacterium]
MVKRRNARAGLKRLLALALLPLAVGLANADKAKTGTGRFLIRGVRVFDGESVTESRNVLVEHGKIRRIGGPEVKARGAEVIDGRGRTLLPGLIDSHVHVAAFNVDSGLGQALSFGVTTVLDMFTNLETLKRLKAIEAADPPDLADVRTAGVGATAPGGHPSQMGGPPIPTLAAPQEAKAFVDARIAEGSDFLKIIYDDLDWALGEDKRLPMLSRETLESLIRAAHARGKIVVVHIASEARAREALAAGADGLAHLFTGETASPDFGRFVQERSAFVIPTLSTLYVSCGQSVGPDLLADAHLQPFIRPEWRGGLTRTWPLKKPSCKGTDEALRELVQAGAAVLAGTDAPGSGTTYGASLHGELALFVKAGQTPLQAL